MKAYWDNLFCDLRDGGLTEELFAFKVGNDIRDDLRRVEAAIMAHEGRKALEILHELKNDY